MGGVGERGGGRACAAAQRRGGGAAQRRRYEGRPSVGLRRTPRAVGGRRLLVRVGYHPRAGAARAKPGGLSAGARLLRAHVLLCLGQLCARIFLQELANFCVVLCSLGAQGSTVTLHHRCALIDSVDLDLGILLWSARSATTTMRTSFAPSRTSRPAWRGSHPRSRLRPAPVCRRMRARRATCRIRPPR